MDKPIQPVHFGKYTLLDRIGAGGMAEIFRAKMYGAHGFEKELVIKKILPHLTNDKEFIEMFIDEAKIMVGLVHSNIVQVFDLGEIDKQYFIGMEFVQGKDLLDVLARCAEQQLKIPLKLGLFILMEALKGLDYAHKATDPYGRPLGLIHRDVSPSNVLISYAGDVKLSDFGVAKATTQRTQTEAGTLKGKVGYMSPEQVRGDEIDHRSDLFSIGIILFEVLNMRRLFTGGSDLDVMLRVRDIDVDGELSQGIRLPKDFYEIMCKILTRFPKDRYESAMDIQDALMDFVYRHRIRVSNKDLSSFMHRVFEKEIAQEQALRRSLRNLSMPPRPTLHAVTPREPSQGLYRYRDREGIVHGPIDRSSLIDTLSSVPPSGVGWVAEGSGPWMKLQNLQAIHAEVEERRGRQKSDAPVAKIAYSEQEPGRTEANASVESGSLSNTSFAQVLMALWKRRADGCLSLTHNNSRKQIFFQQGNPSQVLSNNREELLGNFLVREGVITEAQLTRALDRAKRFGGRLGDALVADRVILSHVLYQYLFRQAKLKLLDIFGWEEGVFEYDPNKLAEQVSFPLGLETLEVIVEGVRSFMTLERIQAFFGPHSQTPMRRTPTPPTQLNELRLTAREFRVASALDDKNLQQLLHELVAARIHAEEIQRVSYLMVQIGFVQF